MAPLHDGILLGHKKEWNHTKCGDVDGPRDVIVSDVKSDPERHTSHAAHVWILNKGADEVIYRTEDDSQIGKKQSYACQGLKQGGINLEIGTGIYTLLYIK